MVLGPFWHRFGTVLASFWDGFGIVLGWFWRRFGSCWDGFVMVLASVGIGSTQPRGKLDVQGHTRLKTTSSDNFSLVGVNGGICALDLSISQNFIVDVTESISKFTLSNVPNGASDFTIRTDQNSIGNYGVGIDTFRDSSNNIIPVYWPGGGVLPIVTLTASRSDIYSFKIINGSDILTEGIYGVVIGQNFAN